MMIMHNDVMITFLITFLTSVRLLYVFTDLNANFKNQYLVLGVSKWGDPNFAGFIMKCTI